MINLERHVVPDENGIRNKNSIVCSLHLANTRLNLALREDFSELVT
jgi:hypothetical protein